MTIQVAIMNGYGLVLASDRHVFRGDDIRSTGQDPKVLALRGPVPAAIMASGPFAVFGTPVSRLALRLESSLRDAAPTAAGPEHLAEAALACLDAPIRGATCVVESDTELLAEIAGHVVERARNGGDDPVAGLRRIVDEVEAAPAVRDQETLEAHGRAVWDEARSGLVGRVPAPVAETLQAAPELCGRAVVGALSRDWRMAELFLTIGLCCPVTGVPALIALRLWRGLGHRLHHASRLGGPFETSWRAGQTVVVAQGHGRPLVEAMIDGVAGEHWKALGSGGRERVCAGMDTRWDRAHSRLGVSNPRELAAIATGLVRGAEVIGYLIRGGRRNRRGRG